MENLLAQLIGTPLPVFIVNGMRCTLRQLFGDAQMQYRFGEFAYSNYEDILDNEHMFKCEVSIVGIDSRGQPFAEFILPFPHTYEVVALKEHGVLHRIDWATAGSQIESLIWRKQGEKQVVENVAVNVVIVGSANGRIGSHNVVTLCVARLR